MKLDLHGYTVHDAWQKYQNFISSVDAKSVVVVTGQGQIEQEFLRWNHPSQVREIQKLPSRGAFRIMFYKSRS